MHASRWLPLLLVLVGCSRDMKPTLESASAAVATLRAAAVTDVQEVTTGLPQGAPHLGSLWADGATAPASDAAVVKEALERARGKVQDLRVAKSTFFALVDGQGVVVRNDNDVDLMAGKNVLTAWPEVKRAIDGQCLTTRGSLPEAAGLKSRPDAQWVHACPIQVQGKVRGAYLTGWSWSGYAYRLENAVRSVERSRVAQNPGAKEALIYVGVLVGEAAYAAPATADVTTQALAGLGLPAKLQGDAVHTQVLEITGREFGLAAGLAPALGEGVAIAVLRSET